MLKSYSLYYLPTVNVRARFFYRNDHTWMAHRLVLSNSKFVDLQFLVTVCYDVSCHVNLEFFQRWLQCEKCLLTYQLSVFSEKAKVTQFARLCRIMTCLLYFQYTNWIQNLYCITPICILRTRYTLYKFRHSKV